MKARGTVGGQRVSPAQTEEPSREGSGSNLMERVVERSNMWAALRRVERNGGVPGVDGMTVRDLRPYLKEHWPRIREALLDGTYRPQPVPGVPAESGDSAGWE